MKNSKIDDSDLIQVEVWIIFGLGSLFALYGLVYLAFGASGKRLCACTSLSVAVLLWV